MNYELQLCFYTNHSNLLNALARSLDHREAMLTEIYIEALLIDQELADQVWEFWNVGIISSDLAAAAWCILASYGPTRQSLR